MHTHARKAAALTPPAPSKGSACCEQESAPQNPLWARLATSTFVQRACAACEDEQRQTIQRAAAGGCAGEREIPGIAGIIHETLSSSSGRPLDPASLAFFGARFGRDFSDVHVHTDSRAAASARSIGALAYTAGSNIVFGRGQYAPETDAGRRLIAHELSHVVQQSSGRVPTAPQGLTIGPSDDPLEREADAQADRVMRDAVLRDPLPGPKLGSTGTHVQRAPHKRENGSIAAFAPWHNRKPISQGQLLTLVGSKERALLERGTLLLIVAPANDHLKYHVKVMKTRTEAWGPSTIEGFVAAGWLEDTQSEESPKGAVVRDAAAKQPSTAEKPPADPAPANANAKVDIAPGPARTNV